MASNFISIEQFKADPFFREVVKRELLPDGRERHPGVFRRLQHPDCIKCQAEFKKKYPDEPFAPNCQGVYGEDDFKMIAAGTGKTYEEAREYVDVAFWAQNYIVLKDKNGDFVPYSAEKHPYQKRVLSCTAQYQVDRMGRGMGKTTLGVILELHKCFQNRNYEVLVLCPAKAQAQMWFEEINNQIDNSPRIRTALRRRVQAPYFIFQFGNGSKIKIFTAGSASGRGAISIRGQSPKRVRLDEQDYLADADYDAVLALLRRFPESEFHGSSTPTGKRSTYWQMCCQFPTYREFYIPITAKVGWSREMELTYRKEAKTADRYNHEYLALFGDLEAGVFKAITIDAAKKKYKYVELEYSTDMMDIVNVNWNDCSLVPGRNYVLGCDWNGKGTGTRIRVLEFDPSTGIRRCVYKETIDIEGATTETSLRHIQLINRVFHLDYIYCDKGFGFAQDELLRKKGRFLEDPKYATDDIKLMRANFIGSRETLKTNRLVPKRDPDSPLLDDKELERNTKPFMVEGAQIAMEQLRVQFADDDERLEMQMRDYRVKTWSENGQAASYEAKNEGDHDLDAWILAMLGIELNYGLFFDPNAHVRLAQILHVSTVEMGAQGKAEVARAQAMERGANRTRQPMTGEKLMAVYAMRNGYVAAPTGSGMSTAFVPGARTQMFRAGQNSRMGPMPRRRPF